MPLASVAMTVGLGIAYGSQQLQNLAAYDELTRVANRRYFNRHLEQLLKNGRRLSVTLCDVDSFKAFNDLYGHPAGDRCLREVAQAITLAVREADLVARYGEEEFVVLLRDTDEKEVALVAERIQEQVRKLKIRHEGSKASQWVTLSGGFIGVDRASEFTPTEIVNYADRALYQAKLSGRNQFLPAIGLSAEEERADSDAAV